MVEEWQQNGQLIISTTVGTPNMQSSAVWMTALPYSSSDRVLRKQNGKRGRPLMVLLLFTKGEGPEGSNLRNRAIIDLRVPGGATQGVGINFGKHGGKQAVNWGDKSSHSKNPHVQEYIT